MPRAESIAPVTNRLLDRLPATDRARVLSRCEKVELVFGETLDVPGAVIGNVYFPTGSFISLLASVDTKKNRLEVALAGNEGLYGVPVALGVDISPVLALVQGEGEAMRMGAAAFRRELTRIPELRTVIERYTFVLMSQLIQTSACNRFHVVEQRLARWLLMTADRAHSSVVHITHEFLASMLGVRRVGITQAAGALQDRGLIVYARGRLKILDRRGLERSACSCYRSDLGIYERIFN